MKRDWMQTGRRPSGIHLSDCPLLLTARLLRKVYVAQRCLSQQKLTNSTGRPRAALYSPHSCFLTVTVRRTITDVIAVVRVGESTIKRRLTEFADTETGDITVEEFSQMIEKQGDPLEIEVLVCACLSLPSADPSTLLLVVVSRDPLCAAFSSGC